MRLRCRFLLRTEPSLGRRSGTTAHFSPQRLSEFSITHRTAVRSLLAVAFASTVASAQASPLLEWNLDDPAVIQEVQTGQSDTAVAQGDVSLIAGLDPDCADAVSFDSVTPGYIDAGTLQTDGSYVAGSSDDFLVVTEHFTVMAWVQLTESGGNERVIVSSDFTSTDGWLLGTRTGGNGESLFFDFGSRRATFDLALEPGQPYLVALRVDTVDAQFGEDNHRLSVWDGASWSHESGFSSTAGFRMQGLEIGGFNDGTRVWGGTVDRVRLLDTTLTDDDLNDFVVLRDLDLDSVGNVCDVCPFIENVDQADADADGLGDACDLTDDTDLDNDGVPNESDVCPFTPNADQADSDGDGIGDACDDLDGNDVDGDGIANTNDVCPFTPDADQADADADGIGDACDELDGNDLDGDGIVNEDDVCPFAPDADQADEDEDGLGDACDPKANGCSTVTAPQGLAWLVLLPLLAWRRRGNTERN